MGKSAWSSEHQRAQLTGRTFGVVLMDLDHFKQINDRHGHQVGDEVLVAFAQAAREVLRDTDLIARWGGEEFLIILPDTHEASKVLQALERLQARLRTSVVSETVPTLRISFSAGYALWAAPRRRGRAAATRRPRPLHRQTQRTATSGKSALITPWRTPSAW
jgi:diguanylate cyclase (GGDEF)-like protein